MAGLFDYEDPRSAGNLAFAGGLLNAGGPQRMPVSLGQALAQAFAQRQGAASEAASNLRRNALTDAQIQKMKADAEYRRFMASKGMTPDMPAAIQVYEYISKLSPSEQRAFYASQRGVQGREINGIWHEYQGPSIGYVPQTTLEQEAGSQGYLAAVKQRAQEQEKAKYDLTTAWDPKLNRYVDVTRSVRLGDVPPVSPPPMRNAPPMQKSPAGFPGGYMNPAEQQKVWGQYQASGTAYPGDTMVPVPGTAQTPVTPRYEPKEQAPIDEKAKSKISSYKNSIDAAQSAINALDKAEGQIDIWSAGTIGGATSWIPGVPGFNLKERLLPVTAVNALEGLKQMRFESPTGAAVGNVALGELQIFSGKWGSLDVGQKPSQLKESVKDIKKQLDKALLLYKTAMEEEEKYLSGGAGGHVQQEDPLGIRKR